MHFPVSQHYTSGALGMFFGTWYVTKCELGSEMLLSLKTNKIRVNRTFQFTMESRSRSKAAVDVQAFSQLHNLQWEN